MRKRDKLYTANKWNQPLFTRNKDNINLFEGGGDLNFIPVSDNYMSLMGGMDLPGMRAPEIGNILSQQQSLTITPKIKVPNIPNLPSKTKGLDFSSPKGAAGAIGSAVGGIGNKIISGGYSSGAGSAVSSIGSTVGGAISTVNPLVGGIVSAASGIVGGGINALFGTKVNQAKLNAANAGTDYLNNFQSNASSFEDVQGPMAVADVQNAYKGGVFKKGWANRKNANLRAQRTAAESWANRSVENNIDNIADTQMNNIMGNWAALGGNLDSQGAIDYGFMSDYLLTKNKAAKVKDKESSNIFGSLARTPFFALGGDIQTNGTDFSTGLSEINAGGSHEENPYQGVQVGISRENGQPNLVEEGETIFDDYVFSKRIKADSRTKKRFHIGKNADISYADLSKKLEKESLERPNDPISQQGLKKQLHDLAEEQERQKGEMQQQEAEEEFNSLPLREQQEIMRQAEAEQQAEEQQAAMQEQAMQQQEMQPVEDMQEPQQQENMQGEEQMNACGGKLNRYAKGGKMKKNIYNALGLYTDRDYDDWAYKNKVDDVIDWEKPLESKQLMEALRKARPALADAISRGYDFGEYKAPKDKYDLKSFNEILDNYTASKTKGNTKGNYAVDNSFNLGKYSTIQELENSPEYKAYTNYLVDAINRNKGIQFRYNGNDHSYNNIAWKDPSKKISKEDYAILQTLQHHINGTSVNPEGVVPLVSKDAEGYMGLADNADTLLTNYRNDGKGGIFHLTPEAITRNNTNTNYELLPDGSVQEIYGNVPNDWKKLDSYSWGDKDGDYGISYYQRPTAVPTSSAAGEAEEEGVIPIHKPTWGRTAGLMGPLVGLGMQAMGIGKPDYGRMNAALDIMDGGAAQASFTPIGGKLAYKPMDVWGEMGRMDANSRATDRAIQNNASPIAAKTAGLLANGYNSQIASGDLYRKSLEYNDNKELQTANYNRGIDQFNAEGLNRTSITNAQILNADKNARAQMAMEAARQRMEADASWNQGIYGNINSLFRGLGDWGKENAQHNLLADMAADGLFGVMTDKQNVGKRYVTKKSCGGKISRKRKRGLTY